MTIKELEIYTYILANFQRFGGKKADMKCGKGVFSWFVSLLFLALST